MMRRAEIKMSDDLSTLVIRANKNTEFNNKVGKIDMDIIELDNLSIEKVKYLLALIERITIKIITTFDYYDIINSSTEGYRTLFSAVDIHKDLIKQNFKNKDHIDDLIFYYEDIYGEKGPRNKIMHYNEKLTPDELSDTNFSSEYFIEILIKEYLDILEANI